MFGEDRRMLPHEASERSPLLAYKQDVLPTPGSRQRPQGGRSRVPRDET